MWNDTHVGYLQNDIIIISILIFNVSNHINRLGRSILVSRKVQKSPKFTPKIINSDLLKPSLSHVYKTSEID